MRAGTFESTGPAITILQHGTDHHRNAPPGGREEDRISAAEPRPRHCASRCSEAAPCRAGPRALRAGACATLEPVPDALAPRSAGGGLSRPQRYGARTSAPGGAGCRASTHTSTSSPWRAGARICRRNASLAAALRHLAAKRAGRADPDEATGWLSHHALHDEAAGLSRAFLFETSRSAGGLRWRSAPELFNVRS